MSLPKASVAIPRLGRREAIVIGGYTIGSIEPRQSDRDQAPAYGAQAAEAAER